MPTDGTVLDAVSPSTPSPQSPTEAHTAVMRRAYVLPGVTVTIIRFLDQALEEGHSLAAYSDPQIAEIADCSLKTAGRIRDWLKAHKFLCSKLLQVSEDNTGTSLSVCLPNNNLNLLKAPKEQHADKAVQPYDLAYKKLDEIGFMLFNGKIPWKERDIRLDAWLDRYGPENVLYCLWLVEMRRQPTANAAGYVRSMVEGGLTAPAGWIHPEIRQMEAEIEQSRAAVEKQAPQMSQVERTRLDEGQYIQETGELLEALSERLRQFSVDTWFREVFVCDIAAAEITLSVPTAEALDWIKRHYQPMLREILGKPVRLVI